MSTTFQHLLDLVSGNLSETHLLQICLELGLFPGRDARALQTAVQKSQISSLTDSSSWSLLARPAARLKLGSESSKIAHVPGIEHDIDVQQCIFQRATTI